MEEDNRNQNRNVPPPQPTTEMKKEEKEEGEKKKKEIYIINAHGDMVLKPRSHGKCHCGSERRYNKCCMQEDVKRMSLLTGDSKASGEPASSDPAAIINSGMLTQNT